MLLHILLDMQKQRNWKNSDYDKIEIAQIMGHASVRSQQSYGRKSKKKAKVDLMTSQMSKPMLNPVAVIDYWDLRSQIKTKQRQNCRYFHPSSPPPAPVRRFKMWTVSSSGGSLLDCEGLARPVRTVLQQNPP